MITAVDIAAAHEFASPLSDYQISDYETAA